MLTRQLSQQQAAAQQQRLQEQLRVLLQELQKQVTGRVLAGEGVSAGVAGLREGGRHCSSRMMMECTTLMNRDMQQMVMAAQQQ
jgi:hypothetical protein